MKKLIFLCILILASCGGAKNSDSKPNDNNKTENRKKYLFTKGDDSVDFNEISIDIYSDILDSGEGNDMVTLPNTQIRSDQLGLTDNIFNSGNGDDIISLGNVGYQINSGEGNDAINIGYSNSSIECGNGNDTLDYSQMFYSINVDMSLNQVLKNSKEDLITNCENIIGTSNLDYIDGDDHNNILNGVSGDDVINGFGGDDIIVAPLGNASMNGGTGEDTISFANMYDSIVFNLDFNTHDIGEYEQYIVNFENVIDTDLDDIISGNNNSNKITSRSGNDTLTGGGGSDVFSIELFEDENDQLVTIMDYSPSDTINFALYDTNNDDIIDEADFVNEVNEIYSISGDLYIDFDYSSRTVMIKNYGNLGINDLEQFKSLINITFSK